MWPKTLLAHLTPATAGRLLSQMPLQQKTNFCPSTSWGKFAICTQRQFGLSAGQCFIFLMRNQASLLYQPISLSLKSWSSTTNISRAPHQALSHGGVWAHREGHQGKPGTTHGEKQPRARAIWGKWRHNKAMLWCLGMRQTERNEKEDGKISRQFWKWFPILVGKC